MLLNARHAGSFTQEQQQQQLLVCAAVRAAARLDVWRTTARSAAAGSTRLSSCGAPRCAARPQMRAALPNARCHIALETAWSYIIWPNP